MVLATNWMELLKSGVAYKIVKFRAQNTLGLENKLTNYKVFNIKAFIKLLFSHLISENCSKIIIFSSVFYYIVRTNYDHNEIFK